MLDYFYNAIPEDEPNQKIMLGQLTAYQEKPAEKLVKFQVSHWKFVSNWSSLVKMEVFK